MDDISNYSPDIQDVLYHLVKSMSISFHFPLILLQIGSKDGFKFLTNFLQQEFLDKALSIIDKKRIVVLQGIPSGRIYYKIVGTDAVHNPDIICFDHYCPCKIFQGSLASNNTLYIVCFLWVKITQ